MTRRTLQLFQLFLLVISVYGLVKYTGHQRLLVPLACLVTAFLAGKVEVALTEGTKKSAPSNRVVPGARQEPRKARKKDGDAPKQGGQKTTLQALDWLLKTNNMLFHRDAVQHLLKDLGLVVSPCRDNPAVDRVVRLPGTDLTLGLKMIGDVHNLTEEWEEWDRLKGFDKGNGSKQRLVIIGGSCMNEEGNGQKKYRTFSVDAQSLLMTRKVVGMTTLTFCQVYLLCKKKGADIQTVLEPIHHNPGGVFQVERPPT